jgi:hypothetical protein
MLPRAALFISTRLLEQLDLSVEDIESGEITTTDVLRSGLIPEAARITGVWAGTKHNPLVEAPEQITLVGGQSRKMAPATALAEAGPRLGAHEMEYDQLVQEMERGDHDDVSLSDVVGKLSPNLLVLFGVDLADREPQEGQSADGGRSAARPDGAARSFAETSAGHALSALTNASIVSLPASLIDIEGDSARPFLLLDTTEGAAREDSKFVGLELSEAQSRHLEISTLHPLEVRAPSRALLPQRNEP